MKFFTVILLDAKNRVIDAKGLFYGTLSETSIYPREVVIYALKHNAAAVILAHNHPTGNAKPSKADMLMTEQLKEVLALVDVKVLDHIIVAERVTLSFLEMGLL